MSERNYYAEGLAAGLAAGSWVEVNDIATAQHIHSGYEDGDPEVMDMQPSPLSGEWAGESLAELGLADATGEDLDEYESGYSEGFWSSVISSCNVHIPQDEDDAIDDEVRDAANNYLPGGLLDEIRQAEAQLGDDDQ